MTERAVKITLRAQVADYKQGMMEAAQAARRVSDENQKLAMARQSFDTVGRASLVMGAAISAGIAVAVGRFAEFDAAMSNVNAATHESAENMAALRAAALDAGASTVFSATEAAGAIEELSKAGVSTADILSEGLSGALDLAAAGGLGVAEAAGIAATALKVFKLNGEDMSHVADLLAAGAGKAMGDVSDLSQALAQGGQVAAATGLSIEETTATLAAFASQGLLGSDAGTAFKTMLQRLTPQSDAARKEMERLGISAYDAAGQFVGMEQFAGNLQTAMADLTPEARNAAMSVMFGSDAVRAANVLYDEGAAGIREWTSAVDDQGYAAETARKRLDNLKGDIEALGGAMDTALIQTGSAANDTLRNTVQVLTSLVDMYNDLPEPAQAAVLAAGGLAAATTLAGGAALTGVTRFSELKNAIQITGLSMKTVGIAAGGTALALGGLFAIIGAVATAQAEARAKAEAYAGSIKEGADATRKMVTENLAAKRTQLWWESDSAFDAADKLGINLDTLTDAAMGNVDAMRALQEVTDGVKNAHYESEDAYNAAKGAADVVTNAVKGESDSMAEAIRVTEQKNKATEAAAATTDTAAQAYVNASQQVADLNSELQSLIDTINESNNVGQDAITANIDYQEALAKVDETIANAQAGVDGYAATLAQSTQVGRDNMSMLVDLAQSAQDAAESQFALDGNTDSYRATLEASRQALVDRAELLGYDAEQAGALADQIFRIPSDTEWKMIAETAAAQATIDTFIRTYDGRTIALKLTTNQVVVGDRVYGGLRSDPVQRAGGGPVYGPGGPKDDKVPALLSNGEHVLTAEEVQAMGGHSAVEQFRSFLVGGARTAESEDPGVTIPLPAKGPAA